MTFKIYDGTTWNTQKSLKIYNGSSWSNAVKGCIIFLSMEKIWIYNIWSNIFYLCDSVC